MENEKGLRINKENEHLQSSFLIFFYQTWENLGPERDQLFQQMKQIVSHKGNYSNYRSYMKSCAPPVVPYIGNYFLFSCLLIAFNLFLGTYLSTLTFIEDGNKDFQLGLINFNKSKLVFCLFYDFFPSLFNDFFFLVGKRNGRSIILSKNRFPTFVSSMFPSKCTYLKLTIPL